MGWIGGHFPQPEACSPIITDLSVFEIRERQVVYQYPAVVGVPEELQPQEGENVTGDN